MMHGRKPRDPWLQRDPAVRLRREAFGGVAFHRTTGDLLELDAEGFEVLRALGGASTPRVLHAALTVRGFRPRLPELATFAGMLAGRGLVRRVEPGSPPLPAEPWADDMLEPRGDGLSAPLVAHWAVTYRCNLACPFCYAESGPWREGGPSPEIRRQIVARLARWGVLEVAIGGGEPTTLTDLPEVLAAVRAEGMVPNVTTNGVALSEAVVAGLAAHAGVVHLSADTPEALDDARGAGVARRVRVTARRLRKAGVRLGVNLLLTPRHVRGLRRALDEAVELGASGVTLLRPKGAWAARRWPDFPASRDVAAFARALRAFMREGPAIRLAVDTALRAEWVRAGLLDDPEPDVLGCGGGQRHVAVTPAGDVHPCSHLRCTDHLMGNLLHDDGATLWSAAARARYRAGCAGARCPCSEDAARRLLVV